jgi:hypothetical protein
MCKAELNVSLEACRHRWYHMIQPCMPGSNLLGCPSKLVLEGWEIKCDFCPFCSGWPIDAGEFVLLGGHSRSSSFNEPLSRRSSLATTVSVARKDSKRGTLTRADSAGSLGSGSAQGSPVFAAGERNRAMNQRVDSYFVTVPESVMDTQTRRTSMGGWGAAGSWSPSAEIIAEDDEGHRRGSYSTSSSLSANSKVAAATKADSAWKKAKRRSQDLSKFFGGSPRLT